MKKLFIGWIFLVIFVFGFFSFKSSQEDPKNDFPGNVIADNIESFALNPLDDSIIFFSEAPIPGDNYYVTVKIFRIKAGATNQIDELKIGGGFGNSRATIMIGESLTALYIEGFSPTPKTDAGAHTLCRLYDFLAPTLTKQDSLHPVKTEVYELEDCRNSLPVNFAEIPPGPYSKVGKLYQPSITLDEIPNATLTNISYGSCIDSCNHKTILTVGDKTFSNGGGFDVSQTGYIFDSEKNLIISTGYKLYKIPLNLLNQ